MDEWGYNNCYEMLPIRTINSTNLRINKNFDNTINKGRGSSHTNSGVNTNEKQMALSKTKEIAYFETAHLLFFVMCSGSIL